MADFYETGPGYAVTESIRVDKVSPAARRRRHVRAGAVILLAIIGLIPIMIMIMTAFKARSDVVSVPPRLVFTPSLEGFVFLLTDRAVVSRGRFEEF